MRADIDAPTPSSGKAKISAQALGEAVELVRDKLATVTPGNDKCGSMWSHIRHMPYAAAISCGERDPNERERITLERAGAKHRGILVSTYQKVPTAEASLILRSYGVKRSTQTWANRSRAGGSPNLEKFVSWTVCDDRNDIIRQKLRSFFALESLELTTHYNRRSTAQAHHE